MSYVLQGGGFEKLVASESDLAYGATVLYVPIDGITVDVTDKYDHEEDSVPLIKGYHALQFKKIRAITGGDIYIVHNKDTRID